jgi:hypothetical protein
MNNPMGMKNAAGIIKGSLNSGLYTPLFLAVNNLTPLSDVAPATKRPKNMPIPRPYKLRVTVSIRSEIVVDNG